VFSRLLHPIRSRYKRHVCDLIGHDSSWVYTVMVAQSAADASHRVCRRCGDTFEEKP
jgi:hypothetical protein